MATIQGIYVALFARPADPTGLAHFEAVTQGGRNLSAIGDLTSTPEYIERFAGQSYEQVITTIYRSLFNRDPDAEGLSYFLEKLVSGEQTVNTITINIMDGARGTDVAVLAAKVEAADKFTARVDTPHGIEAYHYDFTYQGDYSVDVARAYLAGVTPQTPASDADADAAVLRLFPSVVISLADDEITTGASTLVTFTFSEPVVGFELADVSVTGGTLSGLAAVDGNPNAYTATLVAGGSAGTGALSIAFNAYEDRDGINGLAASAGFGVDVPAPGGGTTPVDPFAGVVALSIDEASLLVRPTLLRAASADVTTADAGIADSTVSSGTMDYVLADGSDEETVFTWSTTVGSGEIGSAGFTANGLEIDWDLQNDGRTLVGTTAGGNGAREIIRVELTSLVDGTYEVILQAPLDHRGESADALNFVFSYTLTQPGLEPQSSQLSIDILDSTPELASQTITVYAGGAPQLLFAAAAVAPGDVSGDLYGSGAPAAVVESLGADGWETIQLTVGTTVYTYYGIDGSVVVSDGSVDITADNYDATGHVLTVDTLGGGRFSFDFDPDDLFAFSYLADSGATADYTDIIGISITDSDGDTASADLTFQVFAAVGA